MKLIFNIEYYAAEGEQLGILFDGNHDVPLMLNSPDGHQWQGELEGASVPASYRYGVFKNGKPVRVEIGRLPHLLPRYRKNTDTYHVRDAWRDLPMASYLFTSAFSGNREVKVQAPTRQPASSLTLRVLCPCLSHQGQTLAILGEGTALGAWEASRAVALQELATGVWSLTLNAAQLSDAGEYKFVALNAHTRAIEEWEGGANRYLQLPQLNPGEHHVMPEVELYFPSTSRKVAGTAIPVFSLRSEGSQGVGDFGDLRRMVDWAVLTGQRALQILPINDTTATYTWTDCYPYNAISIYAFHPMYIDLRAVPALTDEAAMADYQNRWQALNALPQVDYEAVNNLKRQYLRQTYEASRNEVFKTADYKQFFKQNAVWLQPYAAFSYLRDKYHTSDFRHWPEYSVYDADAIAALCHPKAATYADIAFYFYLQYLLHVQLLSVADYAQQKGVILKGDIPIGINPASVEAWVEPHYFNRDGQAGAPPDAFSTNGQNWGFPTYNWEVMAADGYAWWRRRFNKMGEYFTAYRIDHILGFFRIWEIPAHSINGILGQFSPALPLSEEEIASYGLPFDAERLTTPFVNAEITERLFGYRAAEVKETFLQHLHDDVYALRPEFDTQRKIDAYLYQHGYGADGDQTIRNGLFYLTENVLFVPDRTLPRHYHPRISVQEAHVFTRLSKSEQDAFNRLYCNYFYERHNQFWFDEAMKKLPQLTQSTPMLACGEDLGMVPACVPWAMDQLQIFSLEIQRMPKNPYHEFGHVWEYPFRSVSTISTHDMSTLRGWWKENSKTTARFHHYALGNSGDAPAEAPGSVCEQIVRQHLESPSLLCIPSLQDWLSIDERLRLPDADAERINIPSNPRHYWRYRMHLTLEQLLSEGGFNEKIMQMIRMTRRA